MHKSVFEFLIGKIRFHEAVCSATLATHIAGFLFPSLAPIAVATINMTALSITGASAFITSGAHARALERFMPATRPRTSAALRHGPV